MGAFGCFDEFNRLEERILSAVSQQILNIQSALISQSDVVTLTDRRCRLNKEVGIFITMNPGYASRAELPENLKQLFRAVAMSSPDLKLIAEVMLFSQGIVSAETLAGKIVQIFTLCKGQLSGQSHYDFGLRALKTVLMGNLSTYSTYLIFHGSYVCKYYCCLKVPGISSGQHYSCLSMRR